MSKRIAIGLVIIALVVSASDAEAACSVTYPFSNGTTADAMQVNQNFADLSNGCAPLASPSFTGLVGVARAATTYPLEVQGTNGLGILYTDGTITNGIFGYNSATLIGSISNHPVDITVSNVAHWRFATDGSFLVSTTTNGGWTGVAKLESLAGSGNYALSGYNNAATGGGLLLRVDNTNPHLIDFDYGASTLVGSISTNGTIITVNGTSDERVKSHVADLSAYRAEQALRAYRPQTYLLRGKPAMGALAQEVDRRFSAIGLDAAQIGLVTRGDANLSLKEGQKGFHLWQMDNSKMVPFLVETGIDHADRINVLETQNALLSRQVAGLLKSVALLERASGQAQRQADRSTASRQVR